MGKRSNGTRSVGATEAAATRTLSTTPIGGGAKKEIDIKKQKPIWGGTWSEYNKTDIKVQKTLMSAGCKMVNEDVYEVKIKNSNTSMRFDLHYDYMNPKAGEISRVTLVTPNGEGGKSAGYIKELGRISVSPNTLERKLADIYSHVKKYEGISVNSREDFEKLQELYKGKSKRKKDKLYNI